MRTGRFIAGTSLALLLTAPSWALAQANTPTTNSPPANAAPASKVSGPKQAGAWTVVGWKQGSSGHCTAERTLPGAAGGGEPLQFLLVRVPGGYRLGLAAEEWHLEPRTTFPVELIADPVLRSDANAVAVAPKVVIIELGADRQLMRRLADAPIMEVKATQAAFRLPLDGFAIAIAELDNCFGALKRPASNPFAPPEPEAKQPAALPTGDASGLRAQQAVAQAERAAPARAIAAKTAPVSTPTATSQSTAGISDELVEERTFLTVPGTIGAYRLEALVVRPAKPEGRLPVALITHGKNAKAADNQYVRADMMLAQARDLAARGWLAVVVIRRGYGQSDGIPGVSRGAAYMSCENGDLSRGFDVEADDLEAALKVIAERPDADGSRAIAIGQSLGGGAVLALAARRPAGLLGVVNVSGGVWRTTPEGNVCGHDTLVSAMATFGARTRVPSLWLYAENDSLFPPDLVNRMRDAYAKAGGRAELQMLSPVLHDGHYLFADFSGRVKWLRALDRFLHDHHLPNTNARRLERVMSAVKLPTKARAVVEEYLSAPMPKVLVVAPPGAATHWAANPQDIDGARKRVLARCREKSGVECTVAMENNEVILPAVTGWLAPSTSTR